MFDLRAVFQRDGDAVAREVRIVGGVSEQPADAARGEQRERRINGVHLAVRIAPQHAAEALPAFGDNVEQLGLRAYLDIFAPLREGEQLARDLFARNVIVEKDARAGMAALPREAEIPLSVSRKIDTAAHEFGDHVRRTFDHQFHCRFVVLVVPRAHGVFEVGGEVFLPLQHADAALREEGIALVLRRFGEHQHPVLRREVERAAQARHARARDEHVISFRFSHNLPSFPVSLQVRASAQGAPAPHP